MTKIECILRPSVVLELKNALGKLGVTGMTVMEAIGFGSQRGHTDEIWNEEFDVNLLPKTKIEMIVSDNRVDEVLKVIINITRTGKFGDGKIFTYPVGNAIRIRTGETGDKAL